MQDPKTVLTKSGVEKYNVHLYNLNEATFFLVNHFDALEFQEADEDTIYRMNELVQRLRGN